MTRNNHLNAIRRFLSSSGGRITPEVIREYLKPLSSNIFKYNHELKAIRVYVGKFHQRPDVVQTFKILDEPFTPKDIIAPSAVSTFYSYIADGSLQAFFLLLATSGLRLSEVCGLRISDIDFSSRMMTPTPHTGITKSVYFSFYNDEAEAVLRKYLAASGISSGLVFPGYNRSNVGRLFRGISESSGIKLVPKMLRSFFSEQTGELGMQDRYVDFLSGKTKRSVLARNYSDYRPAR